MIYINIPHWVFIFIIDNGILGMWMLPLDVPNLSSVLSLSRHHWSCHLNMMVVSLGVDVKTFWCGCCTAEKSRRFVEIYQTSTFIISQTWSDRICPTFYLSRVYVNVSAWLDCVFTMVPNCAHYCQVRFGFACPSMSPATQSCQSRIMND